VANRSQTGSLLMVERKHLVRRKHRPPVRRNHRLVFEPLESRRLLTLYIVDSPGDDEVARYNGNNPFNVDVVNLDNEMGAADSSRISGLMWEDANGNGVRDYGEIGIAGAEVFLDLNDNGTWDAGEPVRSTASDDPFTSDVDETGTYRFDDLEPGIYLVRQKDPGGLASFPDPDAPLVIWEQLIDGGVDGNGNATDGLGGVHVVALSPDDRHAYVTGANDSTVTVFRRDLLTGHLTFVQSLQNGGSDEAGNTIGGIGKAVPIVISPLGEHVYVGGRGSNAIAWFRRDIGTGTLTLLGYLVDGRRDEAGALVDGLDGASSLALSPDGRHLYASGTDDDAIAVFNRDLLTGGLSYLTCYKDGQSLGSGGVLDGLDGTTSVSVSSDGKHVYGTGLYDDTVVVFARAETTGELIWIETLRDSQPDSSGRAVSGLQGPYSVILTTDGTEAIVAGRSYDTIVRFQRDPASGRLSFLEEISGSGKAVGLDYPMFTTLAPDESTLYVPSAHAFVAFERDRSTGRLTFEQIVANGVEDGQGQVVENLDTGFAATTSSDGKFVYATARAGNTVTAYYRPNHPGAQVVEVRDGQDYQNRDFGRRPVTGNQILYIIAEYPDRPADVSEAVARHYMSQANDYYIHNSYGKWSYPHILVTPPLMMPHELAWYDPENDRNGLIAMWADAKAAAVAAGYDPSASRHNFLYYNSFASGCTGHAETPGDDIRIDCAAVVRVTVHEMAHNLGIHHSYYWDTGGTSVIGPGTLVSENPFDPMGAAVLGDLLLYEKKRLGWLDDGQVPQVVSSGVYTLHAMDRGLARDGEDYGLWIARPDDKEYWLEFRQGEASNEWSDDGLVVYWKNVLLDMTPGSQDTFYDSPLLIGRTFSDSETGIHITPIAKHETFPESIEIVVNLGHFPGNRPPVALFSESRRNAFVGETLYFRDESVDPDEQELANFWDFGDGTWQTNQGEAAKVWSQPGDYQVQLEVTDMHGGTDVFQQTITVEIPPGPYLRLLIDERSIREDGGAAAATLTVLRGNTDASQPLDVTLRSGDASELTIAPTVTIPAGEFSITVPLSAVDDTLLDGMQSVEIEAVAPGCVSDTLDIDVLDAEFLSITIPTQQVREDQGNVWATLTRGNTDHNLPLVVDLVSSDPSEATVPSQVTIAANQASVAFPIDIVDDTLLDGAQMVTISASATGYFAADDTLQVLDCETLSLSFATGWISENGGVTTATVTRNNTDRSTALTVTLTNSDETEIFIPATVTIPAYAGGITFEVNALDDPLLDGTIAVNVIASAAGYFPGQAVLQVTDHETLTVAIAAETISEDAGATTVTVTRSNTDTASALVVLLTNGGETEIAVPTTVTLPPSQSSVTFGVTAVDNARRDGTRTVTITASATGYVSGVDALDVLDDEASKVTVTESDGGTRVSESGVSDTFTVLLDAEPLSDVVFSVSSGNVQEFTVSPATLTFTPDHWDRAQVVTVTPVDDPAVDAAVSSTVTISVLQGSTDDLWDDLADIMVTVTNEDNDEPGFTLSKTTAGVSENGTSETFTVVLDAQPLSNVVFDLSSANTDEVTVTPAQVTFTPANWNATVMITVTGVNDSLPVVDGPQAVDVSVAVNAAGSDDAWDGLAMQTVTVTNQDNDVAGFTLSKTTALVGEDGGTDTFTVVLDVQPESDVVLTVASGNTGEVTAEPSILVFTHEAWHLAQTVFLAGVDDGLEDGDQTTEITVSVRTADSDSQFAAVPDATVLVTTVDNGHHGWQNAVEPCDVDGSGAVEPVDVLILINYINSHPNNPILPVTPPPPPYLYYDVDNDGACTPADVLRVINQINNQLVGSLASGEGSLPLVPSAANLRTLVSRGDWTPARPLSPRRIPQAWENARPIVAKALRREPGLDPDSRPAPEDLAVALAGLDAILPDLAADIAGAWSEAE
jgi:6-phosphogluconolactonase (cycloisomerase 2 family)